MKDKLRDNGWLKGVKIQKKGQGKKIVKTKDGSQK